MMDEEKSMDELTDLFLKVVNRYNELNQIPVFYGEDLILHLSEVHLVEAIGRNEGINITNLAKLRGVTMAAVSKMIRKLVQKGLVIKRISPEAENAVVLNLTDKGQEVFEGHQSYHDLLNSKLAECYLELSGEELTKVAHSWNKLASVLDQISEAKTAALNRKTSFPEH
jgi:DNA-binding MarR family transcriptional regulator